MWGGEGLGDVSVTVEAGDAQGLFDAAPAAGPAHEEDDVHGFRDQIVRRACRRFEGELFKAFERTMRGVGVQRRDPAGMAGVPGFQEIERFGPADFADNDAVRAQAKCRADELLQRSAVPVRAQLDDIRCGAAQLARVLKNENAVGFESRFGEQGVGESGFAR